MIVAALLGVSTSIADDRVECTAAQLHQRLDAMTEILPRLVGDDGERRLAAAVSRVDEAVDCLGEPLDLRLCRHVYTAKAYDLRKMNDLQLGADAMRSGRLCRDEELEQRWVRDGQVSAWDAAAAGLAFDWGRPLPLPRRGTRLWVDARRSDMAPRGRAFILQVETRGQIQTTYVAHDAPLPDYPRRSRAPLWGGSAVAALGVASMLATIPLTRAGPCRPSEQRCANIPRLTWGGISAVATGALVIGVWSFSRPKRQGPGSTDP